jgi:protein-disulfide isomerase
MTSMPSRSTRTPSTKKSIAPEVDIDPIEPVILEEDTITFKRSHFYAAISVLTFALGILAGYAIWGTDLFPQLRSNPQTANQAVATAEPQYIRYEIPTEGSHAFGPADAPITIVEFSDFQCPYCKRWFDEVYGPLLEAYPGKIRFVYRHLPLTSIHPDALPAAEAAMCAGEQNAFWEYHDKLFSSAALGNAVYLRYAQDLDLNETSFEACLGNGKYREQIQADSDFALNLGINSTPTFFINGLAVVGAQPIDVFKQVIDKELAGEFTQ